MKRYLMQDGKRNFPSCGKTAAAVKIIRRQPLPTGQENFVFLPCMNQLKKDQPLYFSIQSSKNNPLK